MAVQWDDERLNEYLRSTGDTPIRRDLEAKAILVESAAKRLARMHGAGRVYKRRGITHQASAPGDPVASDTGRYLNAIGHRIVSDEDGIHAEVYVATKYALYTELGTRHMLPRPTLRPALRAAEL